LENGHEEEEAAGADDDEEEEMEPEAASLERALELESLGEMMINQKQYEEAADAFGEAVRMRYSERERER
jgi:hypothetical protein